MWVFPLPPPYKWQILYFLQPLWGCLSFRYCKYKHKNTNSKYFFNYFFFLCYFFSPPLCNMLIYLYLHTQKNLCNMVQLRIKELLKEKRIKSKDLAEAVGLNSISISRIITNNNPPSLETLEKIANVLNVPITELFDIPPKLSPNETICPHCGKILKISVTE